jgi:deoxyribodipyrimidine photolyase-related protein
MKAKASKAAQSRKGASSPQGRIIVVLGDQLDAHSPALATADPEHDHIVMMEVAEESSHVPSHRARTVLFLSAMRHFAARLREPGVHAQGFQVTYSRLDDPANSQSFATELPRLIASSKALQSCTCIVLVEPGEHRVCEIARSWEQSTGKPVEFLEDTHFLTSHDQFARWAKGRKELTMEYFYREQRKRLNILMESDGITPLSGTWNYDADNRQSFGKDGPGLHLRQPLQFPADAITQEVISAVRRVLPSLPGDDDQLASFAWPVTREQAQQALKDFIKHRLSNFGPFEDAMWKDQAFLYHSVLSAAINLKLLHPQECIDAAIHAHAKGLAPLQSVEAFVRQILGWREFVRGVYWLEGPSYADRNWLNQHGKLPAMYWTGDTDMACMRACAGQVVRIAYSHHIQRLMVLGNFALISGVHPRHISDWFLGMYVDAIDWVTLPNTLGMVMHADGIAQGPNAKKPVVGTKPYCSSGQYISKMSNYCTGCKFDPANRGDTASTRDRACPFTVFYWDFLNRNRAAFTKNPRMTMILPNLDRFGEAKLTQISISAQRLRDRYGIGDINPPAAKN